MSVDPIAIISNQIHTGYLRYEPNTGLTWSILPGGGEHLPSCDAGLEWTWSSLQGGSSCTHIHTNKSSSSSSRNICMKTSTGVCVYSHSHQLDFKLDGGWVELRFAQVVLTFLTKAKRHLLTWTMWKCVSSWQGMSTRYEPCSAASASSASACVWGGAETLLQAGCQAEAASGKALLLSTHTHTHIHRLMLCAIYHY